MKVFCCTLHQSLNLMEEINAAHKRDIQIKELMKKNSYRMICRIRCRLHPIDRWYFSL